MTWTRLLALVATWVYSIWRQPPDGMANFLLYIAIPGTALALHLEQRTDHH
ncbi:hypothetical protein [Streptomyces noursei]